MAILKKESGQLLLPILALLFMFGIFLAGYVHWCRHKYWVMRMDVAAHAAALSGARAEAALLNTLATLQMAQSLMVQKTQFKGVSYGYCPDPERGSFENWNGLLHLTKASADLKVAGTGIKIAQLNGANGPLIPLTAMADLLQLKWQTIVFIHFISVPPFFYLEPRERSFLTRLWGDRQEKPQPNHRVGWRVCRANGPCEQAYAQLWLDVQDGSALHNGGFPSEDPSFLRSIDFQCFYPQFNAQLMARKS